MAAYPYMVQTAFNVLQTIFDEWHVAPYRWMRERDLQAEIGGRLNTIFSMQGLGTVKGNYKWVAPGFEPEQEWNRVSYEPYVGYEYEPGKRTHCHPDIVIWKDREGSEPIPEGQLWPILWACELKYGSPDDGSGDIKKLTTLIEQEYVQFGCCVKVQFVTSPAPVGYKWVYTSLGRQLWSADVWMPRQEGGPDASS